MTNKYLEKVALNALKARSMAKAVGVIPDHTSAWKHAVRNLRDNRGNALQGKALHEARVRLGDINNNSFQKIKSINHKQGGLKGYEFGGSIQNGKLKDIRKGEIGAIYDLKAADNFHTHPGTMKAYYSKHEPFMTTLPHRNSRPSGLEGTQRFAPGHHRSLITAKFEEKRLNNAHESLMGASRRLANKPLENFTTLPEMDKHIHKLDHVGNTLDKVIHNRKVNSDKIKDLAHNENWNHHGSYDADTGVLAHRAARPEYQERIVSPTLNSLSVNRLRPQGVRTVYFDHTPRKAK